MATTNATTSLDQARVATLAQAVRGVIEPFLNARDENTAAREQAQGASQAEVNAREGILTALADFSQAQQLTKDEITAIAAKVVAGQNDLESQKSVQQFVGECKRAMHPSVRGHVKQLTHMRDICWASETERKAADKTEPTPLRDAFKRQYHMLLAMCDAQAVGTHALETPEDVLRFADFVSEKQRTDTSKVLKRLEGITRELVAFHKDFPVEDISVCIEALQGVDAKMLKRARPAGNVVTLPVPTRKPEVKNQAAPAVAPAVETPTTVVAESDEPAAEQGDILDEMLGETDVSHLAA